MAGEKILIVEDSMIVSTHILTVLIQAGYGIANVVTTGEDAIKEVKKGQPDLILMDIILAGEMSGIDAAQIIQETSRTPIIYLTAMTDKKTFEQAKLTGPYSYVIKPLEETDLLTRIDVILYKSKLEKENERKRIAALIEGQELERQRVSRDLHDGIGQLLTAIKMNIDNEDFSGNRGLQKKTSELLLEAVDELRKISENIMPAKVEKFDLQTCLKSLCSQSVTNGVDVVFQTQEIPEPIAEIQKLMLYRITQECINNALKHAGCQKIFVQLYGSKSAIFLSIEDDGKGFDTSQSFQGNGLNNIRDRADIIYGSYAIESVAGKGTLVNISVPLVTT